MLERNLENEQHTVELAKQARDRVAAVTPKNPSGGSVVDKLRSAVGR